ncbi:UNVERIFIED_CONTAM: Thiamine pyrophosphokinase [Sesamum latifolium]|uniref:Thiamine pyrophosphokinase n=1 Tax=Sesamum latifolium TaxID=2727402 RepID=A0AAW2Y1S5_9LAMI
MQVDIFISGIFMTVVYPINAYLASGIYCLICILVAGAHGGRSDHEIGNINVLCRFPSMRIILRSDDCFIQLLPCSHHHEIHIESTVEEPHCGVIPISGPSKRSTTTGLQWNLILFSVLCFVIRQKLSEEHRDSCVSTSRPAEHALNHPCLYAHVIFPSVEYFLCLGLCVFILHVDLPMDAAFSMVCMDVTFLQKKLCEERRRDSS